MVMISSMTGISSEFKIEVKYARYARNLRDFCFSLALIRKKKTVQTISFKQIFYIYELKNRL